MARWRGGSPPFAGNNTWFVRVLPVVLYRRFHELRYPNVDFVFYVERETIFEDAFQYVISLRTAELTKTPVICYRQQPPRVPTSGLPLVILALLVDARKQSR